MSDLCGPCPTPFGDHVFKRAHGVEVALRLWPAETPDDRTPWLFWIHGGGFAGGYHHNMIPWAYPAFHGKGYHIVSVGYRLIPHVGIKDQIEDLQDAYRWCRDTLPGMLKINLGRYVVAGDSAGGYFTSLSPFILSPPPTAVINLYGPTNLIDLSDTTPPDPETVQKALKAIDYLLPGTPESVYESYWAERDPAKAMTLAPWWWDLAQPLDKIQAHLGLPGYVPGEKEKMVMDLYRWIAAQKRRIATWLRREEFDNEHEYGEYAKSMSPLFKLESATSHPPTFILHGTADLAVPVEQSYAYEKKLKEKGIPVGSRYEEGGGHSFDSNIQNPDDPRWQTYVAPAVQFVDQYIQKP